MKLCIPLSHEMTSMLTAAGMLHQCTNVVISNHDKRAAIHDLFSYNVMTLKVGDHLKIMFWLLYVTDM